MSRWSIELIVDPTACDGHGVCAEILPERIDRDPWGFPIIEQGKFAPAHFDHAVRAGPSWGVEVQVVPGWAQHGRSTR